MFAQHTHTSQVETVEWNGKDVQLITVNEILLFGWCCVVGWFFFSSLLPCASLCRSFSLEYSLAFCTAATDMLELLTKSHCFFFLSFKCGFFIYIYIYMFFVGFYSFWFVVSVTCIVSNVLHSNRSTYSHASADASKNL